jgi:hypothetical protein
MASPRRYGLYVFGAAVLTATAPALASDDPAPAKRPEVVTIVEGPAGPTRAEVAKLEAVAGASPAPAGPLVAAAPVIEKMPEITPIVIGPPGLTAQERAKISAPIVPLPLPAPAPAEASDAKTSTEKK